MSDQVKQSFRDYDGTRQTTGIATKITATEGERQALADALQTWSAGKPDGYVFEDEIEVPVGGSASTAVAQDSSQLIIEMKDVITGGIYKERLPMPDTAKAVDGSSRLAWLTEGQGQNSLTLMNLIHTDGAIFKTSFEDAWVSPNGNVGTLSRAYIEK